MQPHIRLEKDSRFARVLACGAPERAARIAEKLSNAQKLSENREYHSYLGQYQKQDILVVSHGVGAAGAMICFQELVNVGAKAILRLGTAGGLYDDTQVGDMVVATAAVRQDGVTSLMVPVAYPAVASPAMTLALSQNASKSGGNYKQGIVVTSDIFYPGLLDTQLELYSKAGAVAVEMELSALFVLGSLKGIQTGGLVVLDGNPLKWKEGKYDPHGDAMKRGVSRAIDVALQSISTVKL